MYQTCKRFKFNNHTVKHWIVGKDAIQRSKKGRKRILLSWTSWDVRKTVWGVQRTSKKRAYKVKRWWFICTVCFFQWLLDWFTNFKKSHRINLRRGTNTCQKEPEDKRMQIKHFYRSIRCKALSGDQVGTLGKWTLGEITNVDQTLLSFTFEEEHQGWTRDSALLNLLCLQMDNLGWNRWWFLKGQVEEYHWQSVLLCNTMVV